MSKNKCQFINAMFKENFIQFGLFFCLLSLFSSSAELLCQWKVCRPSHITGNPVTPEEVVRTHCQVF